MVLDLLLSTFATLGEKPLNPAPSPRGGVGRRNPSPKA
jgi:hypothetical protein